MEVVFEGNFPSTSPWETYIWRGDLTEGFLRYRFGGLIFGGAYTWRGLFSEFYGNYIHVSDLLSFKCQLNEDLLEFFVHKVDTKLFKSIFLKNQRNKCCELRSF